MTTKIEEIIITMTTKESITAFIMLSVGAILFLAVIIGGAIAIRNEAWNAGFNACIEENNLYERYNKGD